MNKDTNQERVAISPAEAAELLGIGLPKMYDLVHAEGFPAVRVGRRWLIPVESLRTWLEKQVQDKMG